CGEVERAAHRGLDDLPAVLVHRSSRASVLRGRTTETRARTVEAPPARTTSRRHTSTGRATPHVLPPIRTFTVGPGVPPGQPALLAEGRGSRTVTAGSELHRPRSTCVRTAARQHATPAPACGHGLRHTRPVTLRRWITHS